MELYWKACLSQRKNEKAMKHKLLLSFLFFVLTLFTTCQTKSKDESNLNFRKVTFSKAFDSSNVSSENYVHVKADFIEFTAAQNKTVKDSLNKKVMSFVDAPVFEMKTKNLDELFTTLVADYKKLKKDFPESPAVYELERSVEVINQNSKFISLKLSEYSFLGGAHPNSVMLFINIDLKTGMTIKLEELFVKDYLEILNKIAEKQFRIKRELKPDENLEEAGFWFKDNKFSVNDNFAVERGELVFYFNDYEVAPHAVGPTEIRISLKEIKDLIKPNSYIDILVD